MKVLLVEDDALIAEPLVKALTDQHYVVDVAIDGEAGLKLLEAFTYDLVLLDVVLPKLDGISLCRQLRSQGNQTLILLLTAQKASTNTVMGLDAGADDYVAKPFNLQELLARIRALLRRSNPALPPLLEWHNLKLDPSICEVSCEGQLVRLTPKEYGLLELFLRNPHRIFNTSALIDHVWSFEEPPLEDTIRSHVKGLRQKLKAAGASDDPIETVYGIGYRLRPIAAERRMFRDQAIRVQKRKNGNKNGDKDGNKNGDKDGGKNGDQSSQANEPMQVGYEATQLESQVSNGINSVWEQIKETVDQRVTVLEQAVALLRQNQLSDEGRQQAEQEAHRLAGSLGMFGVDEGSRLAQQIEPLFEQRQSLTPAQIQQLVQLVQALRQELQQIDQGYLPELIAPEPVDLRPELLIVSPNQPFAAELATQADHWHLRTQITVNPVTARSQLTDQRPDVAVVDMVYGKALENDWMLLAELSACTPPVPTLVLTDQDNLIDRIKVIRLGARRVLQQPVSAAQVLEAANQVLQSARPTPAMVMVVDDDVHLLTMLQRLLIPWGLHVSVLDNPLLFLDQLEAIRPDLLILDVEMPHVSGIDLCQVVRNDPQWSKLPILVLTAHADAETMHQMFAAGADDYVNKPIVGPELVTRIFNRLERSRLLKSLAETDALTGVANRRKATQTLTDFMQWCGHCQQPFCLALLELADLSQINQQHGYPAGDEVLVRLGELLRQMFHAEAAVGRWGGATFVVGMPGLNQMDGERRLADLRHLLHQCQFQTADGRSFQADLRVGMVQYPQDGGSLQALYQAAQAKLRQDKTGGDERVRSK